MIGGRDLAYAHIPAAAGAEHRPRGQPQDQRVALDRLVAVKQLRLLSDPIAAERFKREAKALACMSDPNVPAIYDVQFDGGQMYILLEFIDGQQLRSFITNNALLDTAKAANNSSHKVMAEEFSAFFSEKDFHELPAWYAHEMRHLVVALLANPACANAEAEAAGPCIGLMLLSVADFTPGILSSSATSCSDRRAYCAAL